MSLRRYSTIDEVKVIIGENVLVTDSDITRAEIAVDSYIATYITGSFSKADDRNATYTATLTATTATLTGASFDDVKLQFIVMKVLTGTNTGKTLVITDNTNNTVSYNYDEDLTGSATVILYQLGKAPFYGDTVGGIAIVNDDIKQAVAYQVEFMLNNSDTKARKGGKKKSENIGSSYSYTIEDTQTSVNQGVDLAPKALQILEKYHAGVIDI